MIKVGDIFGRLTVVRYDDKRSRNNKGRKYWYCICECGKEISVRDDALKSKTKPTRSCGCLQRERASEYSKAHPPKVIYGDSRERIHNIWYLMLERCNNCNNPAYHRYGGRGISVCPEWSDGIDGYFRFKEWANKNGYNPTLTIDRIDNDGNYCPENCRWISKYDQASNKSNNVYIEWQGERKTISQWARTLGVEMKTLHHRLVGLGWPVERALTQPFRKSPKKAAST